ncbi:MAG TPA: GtrA family protein [Chitinophagaceae bacterium]|nr:GtrA family protein [Chitinophagaceae bacterium]
MRKYLHSVRDFIISGIDYFYPLFSKILDLQTFRYAACGGANSVFDILLYSFTYNYILQKSIIHFGGIAISPYIAAMMITFPVTLFTGFILMRYVVFPDSKATRKRVQGSRYVGVVICCIFLNYIFLKLFVEKFGWWPLPSKMVTTVLVVLFSYFSQKHFTFRVPSTIKS